MRSPGLLQQELELLSGKRIEMRVNRNRVSVLRKTEMGRKRLKVSIHQKFLEAPLEVVEAVGDWLRGKETESGEILLRDFIHNLEVDKRPRPAVMETRGRHYDLQEIYHRLNERYFDGGLELGVTWYKPPGQRRRNRQVTLGTYCSDSHLVRINTVLDSPKVIPEFVEFVVYHEMVHHVVPAQRDRAGRRIVHSRAFRERERQYEFYDKARHWEDNHFRIC